VITHRGGDRSNIADQAVRAEGSCRRPGWTTIAVLEAGRLSWGAACLAVGSRTGPQGHAEGSALTSCRNGFQGWRRAAVRAASGGGGGGRTVLSATVSPRT